MAQRKKRPAPKARASSFRMDEPNISLLRNQIMLVLADYQGVRLDHCEKCGKPLQVKTVKELALLERCPTCGYAHVGFSTKGEGIRIEVADRIVNNLKYIAAQ